MSPFGRTTNTAPLHDRICSAEETFERIAPLLPHYGITRLARLTGLDRTGIPVWNAVAPNARSITISQGKGITDADAKVSAAMEALERAVAGKPDVTILRSSLRKLTASGHHANGLPCLIGLGQADIGADEEVDWVQGTNIITNAPIYVPYEAILLDQTRQDSRFWQSSDGLASGNTVEEAILHGLLERIERDAYTLWQVGTPEQRLAGCIDPLSFPHRTISEMIEMIEAAGLALRLFDMTTDIGIPCHTALLGPSNLETMRAARFFDVTHGSGAHPDPARATIRAITEAAQSRLTFISGARDDIDPAAFEQLLPEEIRAQMAAKPIKQPKASALLPKGAGALLTHTIGKLQKAEIEEAIAVQLTAPDAAFAVAKVFIPQLENPEGSRKRRFGPRAIARTLDIL